jgi:uncharacterized protein (DUF2141 family)
MLLLPFIGPEPPKRVAVVGAEQRNITLNITDTDMPNGDIQRYIFKLSYKFYSDDDDYKIERKEVALDKTESSIYTLNNLMPGKVYKCYIVKFVIL